MNILYIHQYFTTPQLGGATRSYEFARRWVADGHNVCVITGRRLTKADDLPPGIRVLSTATNYSNEMRRDERIRAFLHFARRTARLGTLVRPDVIYATSTPLTVGLPALYLSRYHRVPYVFEVRDLWPEAPIQMGVIRNPALKFALRRFERTIYRHAAHVVALSPGMVDGILAAGVDGRKVSMVPNASDLEVFEPGPIDTAFLREKSLPERPTVAYAGALGEANGIDVLASAIAILRQRRVNVQVVVAGHGKMHARLEREKTERQLDNLHLIGKLSKWDVAKLYKASVGGLVTFSAVPILQTNSPNKFFDLLAAGRPVITNMSGWIADLVINHGIGFVAPPGDAQGLADAIQKAAASDAIHEMGEAARRLAECQFDRDVLSRKVIDILERVVQTSSG